MRILMLILFIMAIYGCNTVQGVGKDMEKGGEWIQKKAK